MSERPKYLYLGLAGLGMAGAFFALQEMFGSSAKPVAEPSTKKLAATGPIVIAPPKGLITGEDTHRVQAKLREATGPVDMVIHAYGGFLAAVDPIVHAVKSYNRGKVRAFVPYFAYSGGTMVALAADQIGMGEGAVLGPVDPQISGFAAADLIGLSNRKSADAIDDAFVLMAGLAEKTYNETRTLVEQLVKSRAALDRLTSGSTSHAKPITFAEAKTLQLPVSEGVPEAYYRLLEGRLKRPRILWEL